MTDLTELRRIAEASAAVNATVVVDLIDRLERAEKLLDMVAGVAASSIPDMSLRGKPMGAVVALATTLSAAEKVIADALNPLAYGTAVTAQGREAAMRRILSSYETTKTENGSES